MTASGVVVIAVDPGDPDVMHRPPRDPKVPITNRPAISSWVVYAAVLFVAALVPLVAGPDEPSTDVASASLTMTFVVMGLGTVFNALTNRRDPASGLEPPLLQALVISLFPVAMLVLGDRAARPAEGLLTTSLTGRQWLACFGLAAAAAGGDRDQQVAAPPRRAPGQRAAGCSARGDPATRGRRARAITRACGLDSYA